LSFVNLNLGRYVVEGTACIFGAILSVQRNGVDLIEIINCNLRTVDFVLSWSKTTGRIRPCFLRKPM